VTFQYRVTIAKKDERIEGPDDAEVVFTSTLDVVVAPGFDATVEFMRGRVKAIGHSGRVLDALRSGEATAAFARLAVPAS
jgi:putative transposon-encoded protein